MKRASPHDEEQRRRSRTSTNDSSSIFSSDDEENCWNIIPRPRTESETKKRKKTVQKEDAGVAALSSAVYPTTAAFFNATQDCKPSSSFALQSQHQHADDCIILTKNDDKNMNEEELDGTTPALEQRTSNTRVVIDGAFPFVDNHQSTVTMNSNATRGAINTNNNASSSSDSDAEDSEACSIFSNSMDLETQIRLIYSHPHIYSTKNNTITSTRNPNDGILPHRSISIVKHPPTQQAKNATSLTNYPPANPVLAAATNPVSNSFNYGFSLSDQSCFVGFPSSPALFFPYCNHAHYQLLNQNYHAQIQQHRHHHRHAIASSTRTEENQQPNRHQNQDTILQKQPPHPQQMSAHPKNNGNLKIDPGTGRKRNRTEQRWLQRFQELKAFYKEKGHSNVPNMYTENQPLGRWVENQKASYKAFLRLELVKNDKSVISHATAASSSTNSVKKKTTTPLTKERIDLLSTVAFKFPETNEEHRNFIWNKRFEELKAYYKEHGHSNVPRGYKVRPKLGGWVSKQRSSYRAFLETNDRQQIMKNSRNSTIGHSATAATLNNSDLEPKLSCQMTQERIAKLSSVAFKFPSFLTR